MLNLAFPKTGLDAVMNSNPVTKALWAQARKQMKEAAGDFLQGKIKVWLQGRGQVGAGGVRIRVQIRWCRRGVDSRVSNQVQGQQIVAAGCLQVALGQSSPRVSRAWVPGGGGAYRITESTTSSQTVSVG